MNTQTVSTSTATARAIRAGIKLDTKTFARAIEKATRVKPRVVNVGAYYGVSRADGGIAVVRFTARDGGIWASCSCPAQDKRWPLPCYHVAAAALSKKQAHERAGDDHAVIAAHVPQPHSHFCTSCESLESCDVPWCAEIDDMQCTDCDEAQTDWGSDRLDKLQWV